MVQPLFLPSSFILGSVLLIFYQDGPCNEVKLCVLWNGQRFGALMNRRNTRRTECCSLFLFGSLLKPQDVCWRRPPPSIAISSLVRRGIKRSQRGKVIFFSYPSILLVGFFPLFHCTFIKLIIILVRSPCVWTNGFLLFPSHSSALLSQKRKKKSYINIWSSLYKCTGRARCVSSATKVMIIFKKNNNLVTVQVAF